MTIYQALESTKTEEGNTLALVEKNIDDLPEGDLLIKVSYSSLNYKDAMSATGMPGVTRNYPHTPGIDAVGEIENSSNTDFKEGDKVTDANVFILEKEPKEISIKEIIGNDKVICLACLVHLHPLVRLNIYQDLSLQ